MSRSRKRYHFRHTLGNSSQIDRTRCRIVKVSPRCSGLRSEPGTISAPPGTVPPPSGRLPKTDATEVFFCITLGTLWHFSWSLWPQTTW